MSKKVKRKVKRKILRSKSFSFRRANKKVKNKISINNRNKNHKSKAFINNRANAMNIINIKINPIQQTNRRRRKRKQLNKSLNKKPVDNVQGYFEKANTKNMKPSSYYNPNNSFQRTKDLLLQDERTKFLLEDNSTKKLNFDSGKDNELGIENIEYPRLEFKDPLRTKNRLLAKRDTAQTRPLAENKRLKNEPEFEEDDNNNRNVHTEDASDSDNEKVIIKQKEENQKKKYHYEAYKQAVEEQNPNIFSKSALNSKGGTTDHVLYYMYDKALRDKLLTPSSKTLDRGQIRNRLSSLLPVKPRKRKNKNKNKK